MRRPLQFLLATVIAAGVSVGLAVPHATLTGASASATRVDSVRLNGFEAALASSINQARRNAGVPALTVVPGATDVARRWSWHMASTQLLSHNPSIVHDLETSGSGSWTALAENVGFGPSEDPGVLFQAYMNSPPHRANILDRSTRYLGVGTVERSGIAWNTLDFVNAYSSRYGMTRVPAAGMAMDRVTIRRTTDVAMLESSQDQRFGTRGSGAVKASPVGFTGPTAANDAAYLRMHTVGSGRGAGSLIMRDALVLSHADAVLLQLAANSPSGRSVPVRVTLRRSFGADVLLGTVSVGPHARFVTLSLPSAARNFRNTLVLTVSGQAVRHAGGRLRLALFDVRARVAQ